MVSYVQNDAVVLGILIAVLAFVFKTSSSSHPVWKKIYKVVPSVLLCYFIPSILTSLGVIDPDKSKLYYVASRYLLPASLVLLTLSVDLREVVKLGPKAIIMFFTGTVGVILGGPVALLCVSYISPDLISGVEPDQLWKGMSTVAGSWIGGGANQVAMKEIFEVDPKIFSAMITVDVLVANFWMAFLLYGAQKAKAIDKKMGANTDAIKSLIQKMINFEKRVTSTATTGDMMLILAVAFGSVGIGHLVADYIAPAIKLSAPYLSKFSLTSKFFWLIVITTTIGIIASFTKLRNLEGKGASKIGTLFLYVLVATVGMKMDALAIIDHPGLFVIGFIWMLVHIVILLVMARLIRAPFFFVAVGSKANIGGAVSAPIVASAVHPKLAPVGVLLAVVGYAVGTYGAWICAQLMRISS